MKIYSIRRSESTGTFTTYFGVVSKKRTGFYNENVVGVRTYIEHEGAPRHVPNDDGTHMMDVADARKRWHEQSKLTHTTGIVIDSEGEDVLTSNGREPMTDFEVITEMDTYAEANSLRTWCSFNDRTI